MVTLQDLREGSATSSTSLYLRISSLRDWLEAHFGVILERAEECRQHLDAEALEGKTGS